MKMNFKRILKLTNNIKNYQNNIKILKKMIKRIKLKKLKMNIQINLFIKDMNMIIILINLNRIIKLEINFKNFIPIYLIFFINDEY